jgi:hypothetical protein
VLAVAGLGLAGCVEPHANQHYQTLESGDAQRFDGNQQMGDPVK